MRTTEKDAFFHRVQITQAICTGLEAEIRAHTNADPLIPDERWRIEFTKRFDFRLIDETYGDRGITRDYGWYASLDEVGRKIKAIFPGIELKALTT